MLFRSPGERQPARHLGPLGDGVDRHARAECRQHTGRPTRAGHGHDGSRLTGVATRTGAGDGELRADAYVLALGSYSPLLARPLGIRLPVYPVKGYSITVPVTDPKGAPESTVMDETHKVALTRLGDRIRVAGMAEINGYDLSLPDARQIGRAHV